MPRHTARYPGWRFCSEWLAFREGQGVAHRQRTYSDTARKPRVSISFLLQIFQILAPLTPLYRNKAVSDGAISFYLDHYVRTRVAKVTYGSKVSVPYRTSEVEHVKRSATVFTDVDGTFLLPGGFRTVLQKVGITFPYFDVVLICGRIPKFRKPKNSLAVWHGTFPTQRRRAI